MEAYAGIDLHSSNSYIGIIDEQDERHFGKRLPNSLTQILVALEPFKKDLKAVVVESTYNWYWLIDGLHEEGYKVHLANPSAIKQYDGLYPKEERPVRDLLRRRLLFVRQRTAQILSLQSAIARNLSLKMSGSAIKKLTEEDAEGLFDSPYLVLTAKSHIGVIQFLTKTIKAIEDAVKSQAKLRKEFQLLKTISGIGDILSLTIMLEVGDINRFPKVGNYSSYCRCVKSEKLSNGKKKGENNRKNGNRYLSWAYVEAANFAIRFSPEAQKFYQRKMAKRNKIVAIKALSNKLARASYYVMRDQVAYDAGKLFG